MSARLLFSLIGALAITAGAGAWLLSRPPAPGSADTVEATIAPAALFATSFRDAAGQPQALGQFQGKVVVVNFWATWCVPCREEMPAFARLQNRWAAHGVQFVGLANEEPSKVHPFGKSLAINYPLWTGGQEVSELARRLGNRVGGLPYTVIVGTDGKVLERRVGPYSEADLEKRLAAYTGKSA